MAIFDLRPTAPVRDASRCPGRQGPGAVTTDIAKGPPASPAARHLAQLFDAMVLRNRTEAGLSGRMRVLHRKLATNIDQLEDFREIRRQPPEAAKRAASALGDVPGGARGD